MSTLDFSAMKAPLDDKDPDILRQIGPVLDQTQGHILDKHRRDHVWNILIRFRKSDPGKALGWLASHIPSVTELRRERHDIHQALRARSKPHSRRAVCFAGFSSQGLHKLGFDLAGFSPEFREGFRHRYANRLGYMDTCWDRAWRGNRFDALLVCAADSESDLAKLEKTAAGHLDSVADVHVEKGIVKRRPSPAPEVKGEAIEHFGFADGVSQPVFFANDRNARTPAWTSLYDPAARLNLALVPDPVPSRAGDRFGSYMAYLRIEQHPATFETAVAEVARFAPPQHGMVASEYAAALIIGRQRDGDPLMGGAGGRNDFDRAQDPTGSSCPFAAHVSKMNARTGEDGGRRIVRRSVTYEDGETKGLLFQSFQADLQFQFEEQLSLWADNVHHPADNTGQDPVMGTRRALQQFPSGNPASVCVSQLATIRGGEYFYFPSIPAVRAMAR